MITRTKKVLSLPKYASNVSTNAPKKKRNVEIVNVQKITDLDRFFLITISYRELPMVRIFPVIIQLLTSMS